MTDLVRIVTIGLRTTGRDAILWSDDVFRL